MGVDLHFIVSLDKYNWKQIFMQTHGMCVDLNFQMSLDKRNWKKTFMHTQGMCVDLPFKISQKIPTEKRHLCKPKKWV